MINSLLFAACAAVAWFSWYRSRPFKFGFAFAVLMTLLDLVIIYMESKS
jgi:hypothetical protein